MRLRHLDSGRFWEIIDEQSPWQKGNDYAIPTPLTKRPLAEALWRALLHSSPLRYHVLLGPRRTGKTTILRQTARELMSQGVAASKIFYISLDHPELRRETLDDLAHAICSASGADTENPAFLLLDEIGGTPDWGVTLKMFYDLHLPVRIAATSSAASMLRAQRTESGVGRWLEHKVMPCQFSEYSHLAADTKSSSLPEQGPRLHLLARGDCETLAERLKLFETGQALPTQPLFRQFSLIGALPEFAVLEYASENEASSVSFAQELIRGDIVEKAIYRDMPMQVELRNPQKAEEVLTAVASRMAQKLSVKNIGDDLEISAATVETYLSHLADTYLIFSLPNYAKSASATLRRNKKTYFVDAAVANAVLRRSVAQAENPTLRGHLLENIAASALWDLSLHSPGNVYHWSRKGEGEVDLIFNDTRDPLAFEIGSSPSHSKAGLRKFLDTHEQFRNRAYLVTPESRVAKPEASKDGIGELPLTLFLLAAGEQSRQEILLRASAQLGLDKPALS